MVNRVCKHCKRKHMGKYSLCWKCYYIGSEYVGKIPANIPIEHLKRSLVMSKDGGRPPPIPRPWEEEEDDDE